MSGMVRSIVNQNISLTSTRRIKYYINVSFIYDNKATSKPTIFGMPSLIAIEVTIGQVIGNYLVYSSHFVVVM